MFQVFIYHILLPVVVMILFSLISRLITGNWLQLFKMIPITVWIIVGLFILMWIIIITRHKKLAKLESEIRDLKEKLKIKGEIFFEKNACWLKKENAKLEGPFCSGCWDNEDKKQLIHLHQVRENVWRCPLCNVEVLTMKNIKDPSYVSY